MIKIVPLRRGGCLLIPLLLVGCMTIGPDYQRPEIAVPVAWQTPVGDSSDTLVDWWTVFQDPALEALMADTRSGNRSLVAAIARMDSYAASYGMTRAGLFPAATAQGGVGYNRQTERVHSPLTYAAVDNPGWLYQGGFTMAWELDLWGRVRRMIEAARGELDASLEDVRHTQVLLQAQAAGEYILLRTLQQRILYAERNIELQRETLNVVRGRFDAGLTGELDIFQATMNLAATEAQVPALRARLAESLNALCLLTGRLPGELNELFVPGPVPSATALPGLLPAELLRRRPDVRSAERKLAAQTARIGAAEGDLYPMLALNGSFSLASTYAGEFFSTPAQSFNIGPVVNWSIFNAGKVRNRIRAEEAATRAAAAQYEQAVLVAFRECEDALAALAHEGDRFVSLSEAVQAAEQAVELVSELYRTGLSNFQSVLDAQRQLAQYQDTLAQSQGQLATGLVAVYKAFGGGWQADVTPGAPLTGQE